MNPVRRFLPTTRLYQTAACVSLATLLSLPVWASQTSGSAEKAGNSVGTFQRYLSELQQKPNDDSLRKKVIDLGKTLKPTPEVPKAARGEFAKGYSLQREAKSSPDYQAAIDAYEKALGMAPWWAAVYYHLGTAYESIGNYDAAIHNFQMYLASHPGHAGEQEALDRIRRSEQDRKKGAKPTSGSAGDAKSPSS